MKTIFGNEIPAEWKFIARPEGIGKVMFGFSSLREGKKVYTQTERLAIRAGAAMIGAVGGTVAAFYTGSGTGATVAWVLVPALIFLGIAAGMTPSRFYNVFLGTEGFAEYEVKADGLEPVPKGKIKFTADGHLIRKLVDHYKNGVYQYTAYTYRWVAGNGSQLYRASHQYNKKTKHERVDRSKSYLGAVQYYYLNTAEQLWTAYLKEDADKKLQVNRNATFDFPIFSSDNRQEGKITLGQHMLTLEQNGQTLTFRDSELKQARFEKGTLYITDKEYRWKLFGRQGNNIAIPVERIANCLFFLMIEKELLKIS
ncbi:MAG TPA: hypothetical protein VFU15_03050 [Bacteroidia bacterium]|nr:hypothetical protein [Bacteroidia bacterium]